jgi:phasin family protein
MPTVPAKRAAKVKATARPATGKAKAAVARPRAKARPRGDAAAAPAKPAETVTKAGGGALSEGVSQAMGMLKMPDFAGMLVTARRKDLQAIVQANRRSYAGLQTVVDRQSQALKDAVSEWQLVLKMLAQSGPREALSKLDELAVASFKMALNNIRELAEMTARSQADAYAVVSRRIREDIEEVTRLLERK